jgi:hypothetical protein|tara:strand:+ start:5946 stop:6506 length:561 start_codon:yes stop_codon:yes gene_type:complete
MKPRIKKYLLFMFGNWDTIEKNAPLMDNIRDVMETIVSTNQFTFVTGDKVIIMCLKSELSFEDINQILTEFIEPNISTYFLMPKPRKLGYRLDKNLESHLFGDGPTIPQLNIDPRVAKALTEQLKNLMDNKVNRLKDVLLNPIVNKLSKNKLRPLNVDKVLDKIIDEGIGSLTEDELDFLKKYNNI